MCAQTEASSAKRPNFRVALEILLLFSRFPVSSHSCVTQLIVNPDAKIFRQFPARTAMPSAWEVGIALQLKRNRVTKRSIT